MAYTDLDLQNVRTLIDRIESRKKHSNAAPTYKDSPSLKEIAIIALSLKGDIDGESLEDQIFSLKYVCDAYYIMGRTGLSNKLYPYLLKAHVALVELMGDEKALKNCENDFYWAVKAANYYEEDDCEQLIKIVRSVLSKEKIQEKLNSAKSSRKGLPKSDPIEKSEEYLAVIDEVEQLIDENAKMKDFCIEYWNLKGHYLAERGIYWRSPVILNPGFMFD